MSRRLTDESTFLSDMLGFCSICAISFQGKTPSRLFVTFTHFAFTCFVFTLDLSLTLVCSTIFTVHGITYQLLLSKSPTYTTLMIFFILLIGASRVFSYTCPNHFNLFLCIFVDKGQSLTVL